MQVASGPQASVGKVESAERGRVTLEVQNMNFHFTGSTWVAVQGSGVLTVTAGEARKTFTHITAAL